MTYSQGEHPSSAQIRDLARLFAENRFDLLIEQAEQLVRQFPKAAELHNILSVGFNAVGDHRAAAQRAAQAIRIQPDYAKAYLNLGNALAGLGEREGALKSFRKALAITPEFAEGHNNLGVFLMNTGRLDAAEEHLSKAVGINPGYARAHNNLGCTLLKQGRNEEAIAQFDVAIGLQPEYAEAHNNLACALQNAGKKQHAIEHFSRTVRLNPRYTEAFRQLASLISFSAGDPLHAQMLELHASGELDDAQRMHLCFGLAKAEEDLGHDEQFFDYLQEGNRIKKQLTGYRIEQDRELFRHIKSIYATAPPAQQVATPEGGITPLFIVGMPRSGTTLVEQILSCHSDVYAAGESLMLDQGINDMGWMEHGLAATQLQHLRERYLSWLQSLAVPEGHVSDKTTSNFRWIGFILQAMPEARVIHIRRDARATCWSNFRQYFETDVDCFDCDLGDLAEYYKLYVDLMAFWEQRFPGRIHHIQYEILTEQQEAETRRLLGYCGLPWEDRCLEFHRSERAVDTASNQQVRRKMYQGSSEAWRKYEPYLQPMLQRLEGY